jgi:hypothetical protein
VLYPIQYNNIEKVHQDYNEIYDTYVPTKGDPCIPRIHAEEILIFFSMGTNLASTASHPSTHPITATNTSMMKNVPKC